MLKLANFLDLFPEFIVAEPKFKALLGLSDIYMRRLTLSVDDPLYSYLQALIVAHILALGQMPSGTGGVKKATSLESSIEYALPRDGALTLSDTYYGRLFMDFVNMQYQGGFIGSFLCCLESW